MSAVIGNLHFIGCSGCMHGDPKEGCTVDIQEMVDNLYVEAGDEVCCGCFKEVQA